jgi:hypothetical protein
MTRLFALLVCVVAVFAGSLASHAQYYTIAPGGPSGYATDTIYMPGGPPPLTGPGATPAFFGPPPPYPVAPPPGYVIDGLSSGADAGDYFLYSVMAGAVGLPATPVFFEATVGTAPSQVFPGPVLGPTPPEAAGDVFAIPGPIFGVPVLATPPIFAPIPTDEFALGLNVGPIVPDDLNSLTYRAPVGPGFYYSLAAGGLGLSGVMPGDILTTLGIWAPSLLLSLDSFGPGSDDIDALLVQDLGILGVFEPGIDFVAFSLAPGSLTLGAVGPGYAPGGGDLLLPDGADADLLPDIFIPAVAFGLTPFDNLDAIDVVPEPGAATFMALGFGLLALRMFNRARRN